MTVAPEASTYGTVPTYRVHVARVRQARPCGARRTNGEPCKAYAIVGGTVCRAHGGSAPQVRRAAYYSHAEARARRQFAVVYERWQRELREWQIDRLVTTAVLLDMPVQNVTTMDIVLCHIDHGRPPLDDEAPKIRRDQRFRLPQPPRVASRRRDVTEPVEAS